MTEQEWRKEFSRRLKARMTYLSIDTTELAKRAKVGRTTINEYLRGARIPNAYTLRKVAQALITTSSKLIDF